MAIPSPLKESMRNGTTNIVADSIEAEDLSAEKEERVGIFRQLLHRMSPAQCLAPSGGASCHNPLFDEKDVEDIVSTLLLDVKHPGKLRSSALLKLYRLTDRERQENRYVSATAYLLSYLLQMSFTLQHSLTISAVDYSVCNFQSVPVVCTTRFNIITSLVPCLSPTGSTSDRRQALLLINNLCIPVENKAAILLGEPYKVLLPALLQVIASRLHNSYLAAACLFNLSFLEEGQSLLFNYVPPLPPDEEAPTEYRHSTPLDNPTSLFRTLESAVQDFLPFVAVAKEQPTIVSVEGELVRFCMGFFRNLVQDHAHDVVTESILPDAAVQILQIFNSVDLSLWKRDSLPDASLMLLVRLARDSKCVAVLQHSQELKDALKSLKGRGGIHETRATALLKHLEQEVLREPHQQQKRSSARREEKKEQEWV